MSSRSDAGLAGAEGSAVGGEDDANGAENPTADDELPEAAAWSLLEDTTSRHVRTTSAAWDAAA
jgi:hypothetical protein